MQDPAQQPVNTHVPQPTSGVPDAGAASVQSVQQPVSVGAGKETAPVVSTKSTEFVQETLPPIEMPQEVKEAGVEEVKGETLEVSPDMQQAGVQPVGLAAPFPQEPTLKFPMTEEKAKGILKMHTKVKESVTWLALLVVRQMQMLRLKQKEEEEKK